MPTNFEAEEIFNMLVKIFYAGIIKINQIKANKLILIFTQGPKAFWVWNAFMDPDLIVLYMTLLNQIL